MQRAHKEEMLSFGTSLQEVLAGVAVCKTEALAVQSRMDAVAQQSEDTCKQMSKSNQHISKNDIKIQTAIEDPCIEHEGVLHSGQGQSHPFD